MITERRRFMRAAESFPTQCRPTGSDEPWQGGHTVSMSAGGLRFVSPMYLEAGAPVDLQVVFPMSGETVWMTGTVVWTKSPAAGVVEAGVQFHPLNPEQEMKINAVVQVLMQRRGALPPEPHG